MPGEQLGKAATAPHDHAVARAEEASRALEWAGIEVSFQAVARRAGVSRQWLFTKPTLCEGDPAAA